MSLFESHKMTIKKQMIIKNSASVTLNVYKYFRKVAEVIMLPELEKTSHEKV